MGTKKQNRRVIVIIGLFFAIECVKMQLIKTIREVYYETKRSYIDTH